MNVSDRLHVPAALSLSSPSVICLKKGVNDRSVLFNDAAST